MDTRLELESVLRRDDWLRRMARGLVADAHAAEDLAQEAWVAELEGARRSRSVRQPDRWLRGVLRNLLHRSLRGEAARRHRAEDAALGAGEGMAPSAADEAELRQLQRTVAAALFELPQAERDVLHLVYFADVGVPEAARRLGIGRSTCYERLQRGLGSLRSRLDAGAPGGRRSWSAAIAPLLAPSAGRPWRLGQRSGRGLLAAAALGGAVVVLAGWRLLAQAPPMGDPAEVTAVTAAAPEDPGPALVPLAGAVRTAGPAAAEAPAPGEPQQGPRARVAARVLLPDGTPAEGARWVLHGWGGDPRRVERSGLPAAWKDLTGTLGEDGRLDARFVAPQAFQFSLDIELEGHAKVARRFFQIAPEGEELLGAIQLEPEALLVGRLVDPAGVPLQGGRLTVRVQQEFSDMLAGIDSVQTIVSPAPSGEPFTVRGMPAGAAVVHVSGRGLRRAVSFPVVLDGEEPLERDFVIDAEDLIDREASTVTVRLDLGPLAFCVEGDLPRLRAATTEGFPLEVERVAPFAPAFRVPLDGEADVELELDDPRFEPWSSGPLAPGAAVVARLEGSARLVLDARGPGGEPVATSSVEVSVPGGLHPPVDLQRGAVALEGALELSIYPGVFDLRVRGGDGLVGIVRGVRFEPGETRRVRVDLAVPPGIRGRARYGDGAPVLGAVAHLLRPAAVDDGPGSPIQLLPASGPLDRLRVSMGEAGVDRDGRFFLECEEPGAFLVLVTIPGGPWAVSGPVAGGTDVTVTLPRPAMVDGVVELPAHLPRDGWTVHFARPDWQAQLDTPVQHLPLDARRGFRAVGLRPGEVRMFLHHGPSDFGLEADGRPTVSFPVGSLVLEEGGFEQVSLALAGPAPSAVTVSLGAGLPAAAAPRATLRPVGGDEPIELRRTSGGGFEPAVVGAGRHVVAVRGPDWAVLNHPSVEVPAGGTLPILVESRTERRRVRILVGGRPAPGALVELRGGSGESVEFPCDAAGTLDVALDPGALTLRIVPSGAGPAKPGPWVESPWPPLADELDLGP